MTEHAALGRLLWQRWAAMWNGDIDLALAIIADDFTANLTAQAPHDAAGIRDGAGMRAWVWSIRAMFQRIEYATEVGPLVDGEWVAAYWRARCTWPDGRRQEKVGSDILRIDAANGRIVAAWMMNNDARGQRRIAPRWSAPR